MLITLIEKQPELKPILWNNCVKSDLRNYYKNIYFSK